MPLLVLRPEPEPGSSSSCAGKQSEPNIAFLPCKSTMKSKQRDRLVFVALHPFYPTYASKQRRNYLSFGFFNSLNAIALFISFFYSLLPRLRWVIKLGLSVSWPIMYLWRAIKIDLDILPTPLLLGSISLGGWLPLLLSPPPPRFPPSSDCFLLLPNYHLQASSIPNTILYLLV